MENCIYTTLRLFEQMHYRKHLQMILQQQTENIVKQYFSLDSQYPITQQICITRVRSWFKRNSKSEIKANFVLIFREARFFSFCLFVKISEKQYSCLL